MFGIGMPEMLLICAIALIVIGPKKLPDLAKSLGRAFGEFKRATSDLKESLEIDTDLNDVTKSFNELTNDIKDNLDSSTDQQESASSETDGQAEGDEEPASSTDESDSADTKGTDTDADRDKDTKTAVETEKPAEPIEGTDNNDRVG